MINSSARIVVPVPGGELRIERLRGKVRISSYTRHGIKHLPILSGFVDVPQAGVPGTIVALAEMEEVDES